MFVLVTGGSGSGKSAYAEQTVMQLAGEEEKYYLATMQVYGEEGRKKVERHHRLRAGKGFETIEQPQNIGQAAGKIRGTALLECMSNLTANEMFSEEGQVPEEQVSEKILREMAVLSDCLSNLVIVTNNVFEDGISYDASTMAYLRALGKINEELARRADRVVEVVAGIPIVVKEGEKGI